MNIEYKRIGYYELPNLILKDKKNEQINKYGYLRLEYLKEHNKALYTTLLMKDELTEHLVSVSKISEARLENLINSFIKNDSKLTKK